MREPRKRPLRPFEERKKSGTRGKLGGGRKRNKSTSKRRKRRGDSLCQGKGQRHKEKGDCMRLWRANSTLGLRAGDGVERRRGGGGEKIMSEERGKLLPLVGGKGKNWEGKGRKEKERKKSLAQEKKKKSRCHRTRRIRSFGRRGGRVQLSLPWD